MTDKNEVMTEVELPATAFQEQNPIIFKFIVDHVQPMKDISEAQVFLSRLLIASSSYLWGLSFSHAAHELHKKGQFTKDAEENVVTACNRILRRSLDSASREPSKFRENVKAELGIK
jgi:hypothetical protein